MEKPKWNPTDKVLNDSEMMRYFIYHPHFQATSFNDIYITCQILRRFETTSNLNRRSRKQVENDLNRLSSVYHTRDITARDIVEEALKVSAVMFFGGHSRNEELYIPRYEFSQMTQKVNNSNYKEWAYKVLSALRLASFDVDEDHLWGLEEPIKT